MRERERVRDRERESERERESGRERERRWGEGGGTLQLAYSSAGKRC